MKKIFALIALTIVFGVQDAKAETFRSMYMEGCIQGVRSEAPILTRAQGEAICNCVFEAMLADPDGNAEQASIICMKTTTAESI